MEQMYQELGKGINPYGLDYPMCLEDSRKQTDAKEIMASTAGRMTTPAITSDSSSTLQTARRLTVSSQISQLMNQTANAMADYAGGGPPFLPPQDRYRPCADEHLETYLNRKDVVQAIHANPSTLPWKGCSDKVQYSRKDTSEPQEKLFEELLELMNDSVNLHMLVFSGDDDSVCSLAGTQMWIWDLGVKAKGQDTWQPWKVHNQTAGFVTHFTLDNTKSKFTFATVHGAGHEVPAYRPMEALELFKKFLDGKW
jgi:carboxypeptidase C (cathepsin A)